MRNSIQTLSAEELPKVPLVLNGLSSRFIREHKIIPLEMKNNLLKVLMADPTNGEVIDSLRVALSADVQVYGGDGRMIDDYISRYYSQETQDIGKIIENIDENGIEFVAEEGEDVGHLKDLASEAPIIKLVNLLITQAVESRASDIHIEPFEDELKVRYRIDGVLHNIESVPKKLQAALVSRVKIMAKLNIAERRLPQDGRIRLRVGEKEIDIRVSSIPIIYGESVVMRILDKEGIVIDLDQLGFSEQTLIPFRNLIRKPHGIILVTGPTGSGKTTTLYGALDKINSPDRKIITVEDPVEYQLKGINQIQVKPQIGLNFANTLRHIVRQDPDVIMIGEMRDNISFFSAMSAAETGHLILSTLHVTNASQSINRILDFFKVEEREQIRRQIAGTLRAVICQRMVNMVNGKLTPALEIMINTPMVRKLLEENRLDKLPTAIETGMDDGMLTFNQSLFNLVKMGRVTEKEALAKATNPQALEMNFKGIFLDEGHRIIS